MKVIVWKPIIIIIIIIYSFLSILYPDLNWKTWVNAFTPYGRWWFQNVYSFVS